MSSYIVMDTWCPVHSLGLRSTSQGPHKALTQTIHYHLQEINLLQRIYLSSPSPPNLGADARQTERQLHHIRQNWLKQMLSFCIFKYLEWEQKGYLSLASQIRPRELGYLHSSWLSRNKKLLLRTHTCFLKKEKGLKGLEVKALTIQLERLFFLSWITCCHHLTFKELLPMRVTTPCFLSQI